MKIVLGLTALIIIATTAEVITAVSKDSIEPKPTTVNVDGRDVTCITYGRHGISCNWSVFANDK